MTLRIRHIAPDATPSSQVSLEALARVIPEATVAEVLKECKATEQRTRKLSAAFVVLLCVAMNLYQRLHRPRLLPIAQPTTLAACRPDGAAGEQGGFVPGSLPAGRQAPRCPLQEGLQKAFGRARERPRGVLVRAAPDGSGRHGARLA